MKYQRLLGARFVLLPLLLMQLGGCAQFVWHKAGASRDDLNRDRYECQMEAAQVFPTIPVNKQLTAGYVGPDRTRCNTTGSAYGASGNVYANSNTSCTTTQGQVVQPVTYTTDINRNNREDAAISCLRARGYQRVRVQ